MKFVQFGEPVPWQRVKRARAGHAYVPEPTRSFKRSIGLTALAAGAKSLVPPIGIRLEFYCGGLKAKDIDNLEKSVLDALKGIAYRDDCEVALVSKKLVKRARAPRTVVALRSLEKFAHLFDEGIKACE